MPGYFPTSGAYPSEAGGPCCTVAALVTTVGQQPKNGTNLDSDPPIGLAISVLPWSSPRYVYGGLGICAFLD